MNEKSVANEMVEIERLRVIYNLAATDALDFLKYYCSVTGIKTVHKGQLTGWEFNLKENGTDVPHKISHFQAANPQIVEVATQRMVKTIRENRFTKVEISLYRNFFNKQVYEGLPENVH